MSCSSDQNLRCCAVRFIDKDVGRNGLEEKMKTVKPERKNFQRCSECDGVQIPRSGPYRYAITRSWSVVLDNTTHWRCGSCGSEAVDVVAPTRLQCVIASLVIRKKTRLVADEIVFLRRLLDQSSQDMARTLGVTRESVSRWETGKQPIGVVPERLLRVIAALWLPEGEFDFHELAGISEKDNGPLSIRLREKGGVWAIAA